MTVSSSFSSFFALQAESQQRAPTTLCTPDAGRQDGKVQRDPAGAGRRQPQTCRLGGFLRKSLVQWVEAPPAPESVGSYNDSNVHSGSGSSRCFTLSDLMTSSLI